MKGLLALPGFSAAVSCGGFCAWALFDLEAKQGKGEAKGVSGLIELKLMLCGPKCFVMNTTEPV